MALFSNLNQDLVDRILTYLRDFNSLAAAIRTSKDIYSVFNAHPKSIVQAVAHNVVGHPEALPAALRLVRKEISVTDEEQQHYENEAEDEDGDRNRTPDAGPDEVAIMQVPINRQEAALLDVNISVVTGLEDLFSWRYKDRTSSTSKLTVDESRRFCRAMYRFWVFCEAFRPPDFYEDDEAPDISRQTTGFLSEFPTDELFDIARAAAFVAETLEWVSCACSFTPVNLPPMLDWYKTISSMGPRVAYSSFKSMTSSEPENIETGFFWNAYCSVLNKSNISDDVSEDKLSKAILHEVIGERDSCDRCHAVRGNKLWGATNWHLLRGEINQHALFMLLPGNLPRNTSEARRFFSHTRAGMFRGFFDYAKLMQELFDIADDEVDMWQKDKWYCLDCVRALVEKRLWKWWRAQKEQEGMPIHDDCWYGYNCRTMTHRALHAEKLNHLCVPTRGEGASHSVPVNA